MKNELINIYNANKSKIFIDFADVGIISSSFADELIGKLIDEIGFYQFQSIINIISN
jgi:anti-anti-sigma regulatory factor